MAVNGGAGNAISFSEIRDFYAGSNPVSLSDYNRGGDKVPQSFAGSETITSGTASETVDDFTVTQTPEQSFIGTMADSNIVRRAFANVPGSSTSAGTAMTLSYTVLPSDAQLFIGGGGANNIGGDETQASAGWTSTGVLNLSIQQGAALTYRGPAYNNQSGFSGALSSSFPSGTIGAGTLTLSTTAGSAGGSLAVWSARRNAVTLYDATFKNNSSTSTYTLTSDSTGTETVYSPGETATVKTDVTSNSWSIAYDKVTGSGAGSAGDIDVSVATVFTGGLVPSNGATQRAHANVTSGSTVSVTYTVTADDAAIFMNGGGLRETPGQDAPAGQTEPIGTHSGTNNGSTLYTSTAAFSERRYRGPASDGTEFPGTAFHGSVNAGDVLVVTATVGTHSGQATISSTRRAAQYKAVFTNTSGSESYTLEGGSGKTSGISSGSVVMSPGSSRDGTSPGNSTTPSWEIHFDTSSGDCNTNIPTTIGAGNPININLFNAPGTPVG